jgi:hypothetical protein
LGHVARMAPALSYFSRAKPPRPSNRPLKKSLASGIVM